MQTSLTWERKFYLRTDRTRCEQGVVLWFLVGRGTNLLKTKTMTCHLRDCLGIGRVEFWLQCGQGYGDKGVIRVWHMLIPISYQIFVVRDCKMSAEDMPEPLSSDVAQVPRRWGGVFPHHICIHSLSEWLYTPFSTSSHNDMTLLHLTIKAQTPREHCTFDRCCARFTRKRAPEIQNKDHEHHTACCTNIFSCCWQITG